ncbi:hypothetical protein CEXT_724111 [Caerostris extrusa]|uniref:Uncharacterized protein n=1 Tax=Caerostris extrusa TaxID=172846 RepID=A0AAV4QMC6_CAEEX|nr:hypothetical protein CEXT_724111 [Caerostris extrusa]
MKERNAAPNNKTFSFNRPAPDFFKLGVRRGFFFQISGGHNRQGNRGTVAWGVCCINKTIAYGFVVDIIGSVTVGQ